MLSGISPWSILLILIIVVVLFGTKKLRNVGSDYLTKHLQKMINKTICLI
jgi:Sec-independent protein translocase protein TatA